MNAPSSPLAPSPAPMTSTNVPSSSLLPVLRRRLSARLSLGLGLGLATALSVGSVARAGGVETHEVESFEAFSDGEVEGAAIESSGKVTRGYAHTKVEVEHGAVFSCLADGKQAWVGTADSATVARVDLRGGSPAIEPVAELEGVVVSAMARLPGGDLVAAVLPGGKLVRVNKRGEVSDFAELAEVTQIWAIVPHKGRLLVATGPRGELWSVGSDGKNPKVVLDTDEKDLLSILTIGDDVLVGTSPKARLYTLGGDGLEGVLLHEFKGEELRAMVVAGDQLVVAVNDFEERSISSRDALTKQLNRASLTGAKPTDNDTRRSRPRADTRLWAVDLGSKRDPMRAQDAAWETWLTKKGQYFIDLVALDDGEVLAASSKGGKIYRARGYRDVSVIADLEERQATALCVLDSGEVLATASDGAAVYLLSRAPAKTARWVSDVLDAKQPSTYGAFALRGEGKLELRVRSGATSEVDDRWSAWRPIALRPENNELRGKGDLPKRRYIQVEVVLADADAELRGVESFYAPENLGPVMGRVGVKAQSFSFGDDDETKPKLTVEWESKARDGDSLIYEVWIRPEGGDDGEWVALTEREPTDDTELSLDLDTLADGIYEVKVRVSDEPSNGSGASASDEMTSDPFVIDRTRPSLSKLAIKAGVVTGTASDVGSYVHDVAFSVDGRDFRAASASDGIFDSGTERFELRLPDDMGPGLHRVVVRARDARGNIETAALRAQG